jgi:hypothetical protein
MDTLPSLPEPSPTRSRRRRRLGRASVGLLLAAAVASGVGACGSDSDSGSSTSTTGAAHATTVSTEACQAFPQLSALMFQMPEEPSEIPAFIQDEMVPVVTTITAGLPHEAADAGSTVLDAYTEAGRTGNPDAVQNPEVMAAQTEVGKALYDACDATKLDVKGVDYSYEGLPDEVPAGSVSLAFTDAGTEEHEIMIVKLAPGEDMTLDEVLALPPDEAFSHVEPVAVAWGAPGETSYAAMDLEPGTYFALCNIPLGGGMDGMPHHTAGMKQTFVVS